jgi:dethiobiotin synthetase
MSEALVKPIIFVTGSDTGVGKTVVSTLLSRQFIQRGLRVAALKPLCSGGREDAVALRAASGGALSLDDVNPWFFRAALAPVLAARQERRRVLLADVLSFVRRARKSFDAVVVEGAGGLLSPLGGDFNARDIIARLHAAPVVVCPNRLGAVNQTLLVLVALPAAAARRAQIVLVDQLKPDASAASNASLLAEQIGRGRIHRLPWLAAGLESPAGMRFAAGLVGKLLLPVKA